MRNQKQRAFRLLFVSPIRNTLEDRFVREKQNKASNVAGPNDVKGLARRKASYSVFY